MPKNEDGRTDGQTAFQLYIVQDDQDSLNAVQIKTFSEKQHGYINEQQIAIHCMLYVAIVYFVLRVWL